MKGEAVTNNNPFKILMGLFSTSSICLCLTLAWLSTAYFSYVYMIPVWIIGISTFLIGLLLRNHVIDKDTDNIESVNDPTRGINDE